MARMAGDILPAIRAIDGNYEQYWFGLSLSATNHGDLNPWWKMDLNIGCSAATVVKVLVWNRQDCCSARLNGATVALLDQAGTILAIRTIGSSVTIATLDFGLVTGVYAVKISTNQEYLTLAEVEVHGYVDANLVAA